jgi:hypothetical protein
LRAGFDAVLEFERHLQRRFEVFGTRRLEFARAANCRPRLFCDSLLAIELSQFRLAERAARAHFDRLETHRFGAREVTGRFRDFGKPSIGRVIRLFHLQQKFERLGGLGVQLLAQVELAQ